MNKTNVHMMLAGPAQTNTPIFGRTNNPWNIERTPGGSSGGAAAALAAGMTPFDIGTDLSASIRIPVHFCGVCGLKPTEQRVPLSGLIPGLPTPRSVRIISCLGPMARTVDDLALLYSIIAGLDGRHSEIQPVPVDRMPDLELKHLWIAFAPTFPGLPVAAEIRGAVEGGPASGLAAQKLARLKAIVAERAGWADQLAQINRMHSWVLEVEHLLDSSWAQEGEVVSNVTVGRRLDARRELMAKLLTDGSFSNRSRNV